LWSKLNPKKTLGGPPNTYGTLGEKKVLPSPVEKVEAEEKTLGLNIGKKAGPMGKARVAHPCGPRKPFHGNASQNHSNESSASMEEHRRGHTLG